MKMQKEKLIKIYAYNHPFTNNIIYFTSFFNKIKKCLQKEDIIFYIFSLTNQVD